MKELTTFRIYKIIEENDLEKNPSLKKDDKQIVEHIEAMLERERLKVNDEARTKQELLDNEKQMHL